MRLTTKLLIAATLLLQSIAYSQSNSLIKHLPDDVTMVIHFDLKRVAGKIPAETFRQSFLYREMMKNEGMPFNTFFAQPEKSGIDLSAGIFLAMKMQGKDRYERDQPIVYIFGKILNAETFTNNIKELMKDDGNLIKVYGTDRIIATEGKMSAGWNNSTFVITSGYSDEITQELYKYHNYDDSVAVVDTAKKEVFDINGLMDRFKKSQRELCFELLAGKSQNAFSTNDHFTSLMNSEADIKIWNGGGSNPMTEKLLFLSPLVNKLQAFAGKNKTSVINFENGKITMHSRNFIEGDVADIYKKYPTTGQNSDLVRRLPEGTLMGLVNMSFNQQMANEMMQKTGLMELMDSIKGKLPFDISLATGVFKSNMMLAVVKSNITTTTDERTTKMEGFQLIVALPIADKAKFEKLKAAVIPAWDSLKSSKSESIKEPTPFAKYNDELLVLSLSPEVATAFLNNTGTGTIPAWLQAYSKYPMVMNINMREIMGLMPGKNKPEQNNSGTNEMIMNIFDQLVMYGGEYENESINNTMEFRFANQTDNALKQLFEMMNGMAEKKEEVIMSDDKQPPPQEEKVSVQSITITEIKQESELPPPPPPKLPKNVKQVPVKKTKVQ